MNKTAARLMVITTCAVQSPLSNAQKCFEEVSVEAKRLKVDNTYTTLGTTDGRAVRGDDGYIWSGTDGGILRRLDPSSPNRVASEEILDSGILEAIETLGDKKGQRKLVVGTASGYRCYGPDGKFITSNNKVGAALSAAPIPYGKELLFVADNGIPYKLNEDCTSLIKASSGMPPGSLSSPPSLMQTPKPVLIYGTESIGDPVTRTLKYSVTFTPLDGGPIVTQDLSTKDGIVTFAPTIIRETTPEGPQNLVLLLTDSGKLLPATYSGLKRATPVDLKCLPKTPISNLGGGRFSIFCVDPQTQNTQALVFTSSGQEISRIDLTDFSKSTVKATPTSEAAVTDNGPNKVAIMGFSDSTVKLIDIKTATVLHSLPISKNKQVTAAPSDLGGGSFFFSEQDGDSEELPLTASEKMTTSYLVSLDKTPVKTSKTVPVPVTCPTKQGADPNHVRPDARKKAKKFSFYSKRA